MYLVPDVCPLLLACKLQRGGELHPPPPLPRPELNLQARNPLTQQNSHGHPHRPPHCGFQGTRNLSSCGTVTHRRRRGRGPRIQGLSISSSSIMSRHFSLHKEMFKTAGVCVADAGTPAAELRAAGAGTPASEPCCL